MRAVPAAARSAVTTGRRAFASALANNDIRAMLFNSHGPESLKEVVADIGSTLKAGTREDAASKDIVFVAVNWSKLPAALAGLLDLGERSTLRTTFREIFSSRQIALIALP